MDAAGVGTSVGAGAVAAGDVVAAGDDAGDEVGAGEAQPAATSTAIASALVARRVRGVHRRVSVVMRAGDAGEHGGVKGRSSPVSESRGWPGRGEGGTFVLRPA